jgi:small-conductance mechanosensitive channel
LPKGESVLDVETAREFFHALARPGSLVLAWWIIDHLGSKGIRRFFSKAESAIEAEEGGETKREASQKRLRTLKGITLQLFRWSVGGIAVLTLAGSLGIDVRSILTGLGIAGLAISLAAQNIIRDFLNGVFIVFEDQFAVGDVVKIEDHSGVVEVFTLRTTRLRTLDGELVTIPNGSISTVLNFTKKWSRARIEVGVGYGTDIPRALEIMNRVGRDIAAKNPGKVLEEPAALEGILAFEKSSMTLRMLLKTAPGLQWDIAAAYRFHLREAFDEAGISIAIPQIEGHLVRDPNGEEVPNRIA